MSGQGEASISYPPLKFELGRLFRDLLTKNQKIEIFDWSMAFRYKLDMITHFQRLCCKIAEKLPETIANEDAGPGTPMPFTGSLIDTTRMYFECFLYFISSAFDILAKFTREFYPDHSNAISGIQALVIQGMRLN
jgi:hypothetical protein